MRPLQPKLLTNLESREEHCCGGESAPSHSRDFLWVALARAFPAVKAVPLQGKHQVQTWSTEDWFVSLGFALRFHGIAGHLGKWCVSSTALHVSTSKVHATNVRVSSS